MAYDPRPVEPVIYKRWLEGGVFQPQPDGEPYVIVIPPPNVTSVLHVGHGLNTIIQDVLIRFERMRGRAAEWLPGTDHAGIATQNIVEKQLAAEGTTRFDLGREAFVQRVWAFVRETGQTILDQLKIMGCTCDWSRTRFTLDPAYSRAVREVFVRLWEEGLIYRGHRVIHWCPNCLTALSDEEAEHHDTNGNLYHIQYPLVDGSGFITVATTRPETMLGDTAVAVHPDDPRGLPYIGKKVRLPIADVEIPIIADESVDKEFGTGFVKVTPAHDASDFEIGLRHKLDMPLVMSEDGRMEGDRVPKELRGVDRFDARKKIVKMLDRLLVKIEQHPHSVRRCYRCDTVVEPRLSDQWFVKMKPLAAPVLELYKTGKYTIIPERWQATYEHWMEGIRDWNISRQLWWGHRIPVFTCKECRHQWADRQDPTQCRKCGGPVEQDPDVLDTWFSSWLWPFATFGWPDDTPDLRRFYPGHTLVTAPEILFFWVARMIMLGLKFQGDIPFRTVYIHALVRDAEGQKMSKSRGNVIDPLEVMDRYGTDALRFTLAALASTGRDINWDMKRLEGYRNFCNKLWNASRFVLMNTEAHDCGFNGGEKVLSLADRWILAEFNRTVKAYREALDTYRFDLAANILYEFTWNQFCDWYLELTKPVVSNGSEAEQRGTRHTLITVLEALLRLAHPIIPFITETIWQRVKPLTGTTADTIMLQPFPAYDAALEDEQALNDLEWIKQTIIAVRNIRAEMNIAPSKALDVLLRNCSADAQRRVQENQSFIARLARLESIALLPAGEKGPVSVTKLVDGAELLIPMAGFIDKDAEIARLAKEMGKLDAEIAAIEGKLANEGFVARAPEAVVAKERDRLAACKEGKVKLQEQQATIAAL